VGKLQLGFCESFRPGFLACFILVAPSHLGVFYNFHTPRTHCLSSMSFQDPATGSTKLFFGCSHMEQLDYPRCIPKSNTRFIFLTSLTYLPLVTGPVARFARQIAGQGYIVAAPSSYHEFTGPEPLAYDVPGTDAGNEYKIKKVY
jgi:hypothetical protein